MRGSAPRTARSSSVASATLRSAGADASAGWKRSSWGTGTPSGSARPAHSSGVAKPALSRASASASSIAEGSSVPAYAKPWRPSTTTRTPTPWDSAEDNDSTCPSYTRTWVSRDRSTTTSTCSPPRAPASTRSARANSSSLISAPPALRGRAADGEARDPQDGGPVADRHALAVLAARAGVTHLEVVAQHVDAGEHLGAVADEVAVTDGSGDAAVLDEVRLGHAEHEVAGGGVDLTAAELGDEHAPFGGGDDVVGVVGAVADVGVRHPHHREVLV